MKRIEDDDDDDQAVLSLDWAACVAYLVIEFHQPMSEAWNVTYREFCLLSDVKHQLRGLEKKQHVYDADRLSGLEAHLKNIGVEI